ncbi:hypothetical protein PORY_001283 [Pneumocystis oryctolagi]|uniref:Uncharacterized protein n=1 Tax=Pneumocystis oryctolagi TaxID=42067 RepID=A0ACB7CC14_9ASCO|nr:hypothetical protein PORY_001283 [Pneumocystis oryctolagi]
MLRMRLFSSGVVLSASVTYILLLQIRSTTNIISESLKYCSLQLKDPDNTLKPPWVLMISSTWAGLIKEQWNDNLRSTSLWIQNVDIAENINNFLNKIQGTSYLEFKKNENWNLFNSDDEKQNLSISKFCQDTISISSDTSGSLSDAPKKPPIVTICKWNGCLKDQGSLNNLVDHLYYENIKSIYICEWDNCSLKGTVQMSRSSFIVHLKSHIGRNFFFCTVPECNKSFIRSDSLKKHMKVIHDLDFSYTSTFNSHIQNSYLRTLFAKNQNIEISNLDNKCSNDKKSDESDQDKLSEWSEDEIGIPFYDLLKLLKQKLFWIKEENQKLKNQLYKAQKGALEKLLIKSLGKDNALTIIR